MFNFTFKERHCSQRIISPFPITIHVSSFNRSHFLKYLRLQETCLFCVGICLLFTEYNVKELSAFYLFLDYYFN